jgi:glycine oxidase
MAQPDVLIVGGGVIGASIAYHLAEAGTRVMVLERGRAGGHASLASAGLLHPHLNADVAHPVRDLSLASFALYPNLVARLHEITGIDPEYQVPGFLMVALREDEVELHAAELSDPLAET